RELEPGLHRRRPSRARERLRARVRRALEAAQHLRHLPAVPLHAAQQRARALGVGRRGRLLPDLDARRRWRVPRRPLLPLRDAAGPQGAGARRSRHHRRVRQPVLRRHRDQRLGRSVRARAGAGLDGKARGGHGRLAGPPQAHSGESRSHAPAGAGGVIGLLLALAGMPFLAACGYLFALTLLSWRRGDPAAQARAPRLAIAVVVPAHDEEAGIAATVQSLLALDYPRDLFRIFVIADNCSDETAARAREAGATVLVRDDAARRGKVYALEDRKSTRLNSSH